MKVFYSATSGWSKDIVIRFRFASEPLTMGTSNDQHHPARAEYSKKVKKFASQAWVDAFVRLRFGL